jgi:glycosyltransferase involved in cell wall biosynthesis
MDSYNLCIIKPNKSTFSETFVNEHINRLYGEKKVLYGGAFPVYDDKHFYLITSKLGLLSYLIQKRIFNKKNITVRTNALVTYLKKNNIDAVFTEYGTVGSMVAEACKIANLPLIIHFHGADAYHKKNLGNYLPYYKKAFDYASGIVAVSLEMVEQLVKLGAPRPKISFISCGVDVDKFSLVNLTKENNFLSVGRFVEKKSPLTLIKAFKLVVDKLPDCKLFMVGNGPLFKQSVALIKKLNLQSNIILMGVFDQEQIKRLLRNSKCFIQHSVTAKGGDKEGTPVSILEAAASGLPIVSTKHGGITEAVIDGVTGYLVNEYAVDEMADRMMKIALSTPQELFKMGIASRNHIIKNYSIDKQIQKLDAVIAQSILLK